MIKHFYVNINNYPKSSVYFCRRAIHCQVLPIEGLSFRFYKENNNPSRMTVSGMTRLFDDANEFMFLKTINIMNVNQLMLLMIL